MDEKYWKLNKNFAIKLRKKDARCILAKKGTVLRKFEK